MQGGTGLTGGTSGGVPYYSAAAAIASSAALANGQVVVGGGAGAAPATIANGQLPATATNDSATAGHVGEYIVSTVASPGVSLTSGAIANITNISLTAGDWDVEGMIAVAPSATVTATEGWVNNVSVTAPALGINGQFYSNVSFTFLSISSTGCRRFSLAATTTIYLSLTASFASGTCTAYGEIRARRMR